ncbi:MAG: hypothetical protein L3J35_09265 [Bacteroidales bacterium]|nr:hypothetical protein [Bacteroidales bacterium]
MKTINKHNYEAFFLDFIEGNLSESQIKDLNKFLTGNPDLKDELESFENIILKAETVEYTQKENLIKQTQSQFFEITQFEYLAIADTEDDNTKAEKLELHKELNKNPCKIKEFKLIKNTKLLPDNNNIYPYKTQLIKRTVSFYVKVSSYVAAAVITLLLMLNQFYSNTNNSNSFGKQSISIAVNNKKAFENDSEKIITNNTIKEKEQEVINSHNQTNKQNQSNNLLAFNDNEPHATENLYNEITVQIPEIKHEALILNKIKPEIEISQINTTFAENGKKKKEILWRYAETGVNIWKKVSSSDFEMNNKYKKDGSIEKLNLYASNFKISKTFNK